jgi:2-aminoethylphosphonate-pyruvate transaminase
MLSMDKMPHRFRPARPGGHALSADARPADHLAHGVKAAMLADWGSRDIEFRRVVAEIRKGLLDLAGCDESYECVIMQGSGTFAIEAALGAFCPKAENKTLVVANGAYGDRAAAILTRLGRPVVKIDKGDSAAPTPEEVAQALDADPRSAMSGSSIARRRPAS